MSPSGIAMSESRRTDQRVPDPKAVVMLPD